MKKNRNGSNSNNGRNNNSNNPVNTTVKVKHLRIDPPEHCKTKYEVYLGNEPLRMERHINSTLKHGIPMLASGPIMVNLTKWRKARRLLTMARDGLTASGWSIMDIAVTKDNYFLYVLPMVTIAPIARPSWARSH